KKQVKLNGGKDSFGAVVAQVGRNDAMLSELATNLIETDARISQCDNSLISVKSKIEQQLERIEFLKSRIKELQERKTNSANHIQKLDDQIDGFTSQIADCQRNLAENETLCTQETGRLNEMQDAISEVNHLYRRIEADMEDEKSGIIDMVRRTAHLHNEIKSISSYRDKMADQKDRLAGRADQTSRQLSGLLTEKAGYSAKLGDIQEVITDLQSNLDEKRKQMEETGEVIARENHALAEIKERRSAVQSEKNILTDMEARREGLSKSVKDILQKHACSENQGRDYVEGIVADIITADIKYADAIEAALEGRTDAVVINSTRDFLEDENLSQGLDSRVKVICTDRITPFVDTQEVSSCVGVIGRAIEFVKYDHKYASLAWHLLGKTLLVESIEDAMTLSRRLGGDYQFVALDGTVLDRQGAINVGPVGKTAGLISRKSRLIELTRNLAAISLQISEIDSKLDESNQKNDHLSTLCQNFRTSVYEANTERVDTEAKLSGIKQDVNRLTDEQPLLKNEIETLEKEISESVQTEHDSRQKLEELESINLERKGRIEELEQQFAETRERQDSQLAIMTDLRVSIGQTDEKCKAVKQQIASLESQLQHGRLALESTRTEMGACDGQVVETERTILATEAAVNEMFVDKEKYQKESNFLHENVDQLRQKHKETEDLLRQKRSEQSEVEQQIHEVELQLSQLTVKDEDLTQRVAEELGINLKEAYQNFEEGEVDWDEVREEISVLRGKIERLGNVNVDAIEEQVELEERYEFLATQVEDLQKSKLQLEHLISRINKESREKFAVTFEQVRLNFQELFRKLFGGGKADIILEDPSDILESGIEILAKPPGKETMSISLLSGGEKSMTALALLFAVFKCKPSPFCFLDEVDAALDEANNERFNMIVQEFRKYSQFIIITHAKRTMSIADALFGVTMQTRGVSKKISVQFDRLETDGEDAAVA
ncbi:MAG: chromosome segregation protein SMC, partial [Planctomycetes bacterium]|nr:chromosome segregation protein SMC [Planctomycetota bacterium]